VIKRVFQAVFVTVVLAIAVALLLRGYSQMQWRSSAEITSPNGIESLEEIVVNGDRQWIYIRGHNRNNPVMLYLHGGPGMSEMPLARAFGGTLEQHVTIVHWDQRGSGKSRAGRARPDELSVQTYLDDVLALTHQLRARFNQDKIYLVGHSWGSLLGVLTVRDHPDLYHAYVGVGQALAWPGGFDETQRLVTDAATKAGDTETLEAFAELPEDWPPREDVDGLLERIGVIQAPLVRYQTSIHASKSNSLFDGDIVLDVVTSPEIGVYEAMGMLDLSDASKALMADLYGRDLRVDLGTEYEVPMFIFQGEHDWQTPTSLVKPWFEELSAPHKSYVPFEHSAHIVINEEPGKFLYELIEQVRPFALDEGEANPANTEAASTDR